VVGVDLIEKPLRDLKARAIQTHTVDRCIAVKGDILRMSTKRISFDAVSCAWNRYKVGEGHNSISGEGDEPTARILPLDSIAPADYAPGQSSNANEGLNGGQFDFILDVQCFHVVRLVDEKLTVKAISSHLKPGGLYLVMTGNDKEPEVGPSVLSESQVKLPFSTLFDALSVAETRFDDTEHYTRLVKPPLAWCGLFRRRLVVDLREVGSVAEAWQILLEEIRAQEDHPRSFEALRSSIINDQNGVERPFTVLTVGSGRTGASGIEVWIDRLEATLTQMQRDSLFQDGRAVKLVRRQRI